MGFVLGGFMAASGAIFAFAWTVFWDIQAKLRKELRKDINLAQAVIWGNRYAPALARLILDLQGETTGVSIAGSSDAEAAMVEQVAVRITRRDYFERVEEAYMRGQAASVLETSYQQLGRDGTRAFIGLVVFAIALPPSWLFALLPGADTQETAWVAAVTAWSAVLVAVFLIAALFATRFWREKARLVRMLDEYEE